MLQDFLKLLDFLVDRLKTKKAPAVELRETVRNEGAAVTVVHRRPTRWLDEATPDPDSYEVIHTQTVHNVITKAGKDFMLAQCYGLAGLAAIGLVYIGCSNSAFTEDADSTTLSGEIVTNGFSRAIATSVTHANGTNYVTLFKRFTCITANQSVNKMALFSAIAAGTMGHALPLDLQRACAPGDTIDATWVITFTG